MTHQNTLQGSVTRYCRGIEEGYRYGFQGQEKSDEIHGPGNHTTAQFWEYDTRLGRRWNTDPVVKEWESSYATFAGNPVWFVDPLGNDTFTYTKETVNVFSDPGEGKDIYKVHSSEQESLDIKIADGDDVFIYNKTITSVISSKEGVESISKTSSKQLELEDFNDKVLYSENSVIRGVQKFLDYTKSLEYTLSIDENFGGGIMFSSSKGQSMEGRGTRGRVEITNIDDILAGVSAIKGTVGRTTPSFSFKNGEILKNAYKLTKIFKEGISAYKSGKKIRKYCFPGCGH